MHPGCDCLNLHRLGSVVLFVASLLSSPRRIILSELLLLFLSLSWTPRTGVHAMTVAATAASVAAISGLAAYINAKYHIGQDVRMLRFKKGAEKNYAELGMCVSMSYLI